MAPVHAAALAAAALVAASLVAASLTSRPLARAAVPAHTSSTLHPTPVPACTAAGAAALTPSTATPPTTES